MEKAYENKRNAGHAAAGQKTGKTGTAVDKMERRGKEGVQSFGLCASSGISETTDEAWGLYDLKRMVGVSDCTGQGEGKSYLWERI